MILNVNYIYSTNSIEGEVHLISHLMKASGDHQMLYVNPFPNMSLPVTASPRQVYKKTRLLETYECLVVGLIRIAMKLYPPFTGAKYEHFYKMYLVKRIINQLIYKIAEELIYLLPSSNSFILSIKPKSRFSLFLLTNLYSKYLILADGPYSLSCQFV